MSQHGDLTAELSNGYTVGQELCLGALSFFLPNIEHRDVSIHYYFLVLDRVKYQNYSKTPKTFKNILKVL